jgi:anti-anti-sigma factor
MEINEQRDGSVVVLRPAGRIDADTSAAFQDRLSKAVEASPTLVDFSAVEFISSAGLAALMSAANQAKAKKGRIAVAALRPVVREVFTIARFFHLVAVYDTVALGVAALQA